MIFKNFLNIKNNKKIKKDLKEGQKGLLLVLETLKPTYRYSYSKKKIRNYKKFIQHKNNWHGWINSWI